MYKCIISFMIYPLVHYILSVLALIFSFYKVVGITLSYYIMSGSMDMKFLYKSVNMGGINGI